MEIRQAFLTVYEQVMKENTAQFENRNVRDEIEWNTSLDAMGFNSFLFVKILMEVDKLLQVQIADEIYVYNGEETLDDVIRKIEGLSENQ